MKVVREIVARVRKRAGAAYRATRHATERLLHPGRHRTVAKRLAKLRRPKSVLVICYGNICRSPYLAAVLQRDLPGIAVSSAGFTSPGRGVPEHSITLSSQRGLDLKAHRSRLVTREMLRRNDLIIVMDALQARSLTKGFGADPARVVVAGDLDPEPGPSRAILDPWRQPVAVFAESFERLERCAEGLLASLNGKK